MFGTPPVRTGGLVRYALDLIRQEARIGETVILLLPGTLPKNTDRRIRIRKSRSRIRRILTYTIDNPLPIPMCNGIRNARAYTKSCDASVYAAFLKKIKPDIIHIHTFMGLHQEFLNEAQKMEIPMVFTTHDYFGICPTATLLIADNICTDIDWKQCGLCCENAYSMKRLRLEQSVLYRIYRKSSWLAGWMHKGICKNSFRIMRAPQMAKVSHTDGTMHNKARDCGELLNYAVLKHYYASMFDKISWFHYNSVLSRRLYQSRLGEKKGSVIPISHACISDCRSVRDYGKKLRVGYFGGWVEHKGFFQLLDVCRMMWEEGNRMLELHLYSDTEECNEAFVVNHKAFRAGQMEDVFQDIDILAVPSRCPETFGFVVLEALSFGVPVIASQNVGAGELLKEYPGCGIRYDGTTGELKRVLEKLYADTGRRMLQDMNQKILDMDDLFLYEGHVKKIVRLYKSLLSKQRKDSFVGNGRRKK